MAGPLRNARHERFAQALAKGRPARAAYVEAGYKDGNAADARSSELGRKRQIVARVAELTQRAAERADVTIERWELELARIAFADMGDFAEWGSQAELTEDQRQLLRAHHFDVPSRVRDLSKEAMRFLEVEGMPVDIRTVTLRPSKGLGDKTRIVHSIKEGQYGVELKLYDKLRALELLGKRHGWIVERTGGEKEGEPIKLEIKGGLSDAAADLLRQKILGVTK